MRMLVGPLGLLLCLAHCAEHRHQPPGACSSPLDRLPDSAAKARIFGAPEGGLACLRVVWGGGQSQGVLVRLGAQGQLWGQNSGTESFDEPVRFRLPAHSRKESIRFSLFVWGPSFQGAGLDALQQKCEGPWSQVGYRCEAREQGECWFAVHFLSSDRGGGGVCSLDLPREPEPREPKPGEVLFPDAARTERGAGDSSEGKREAGEQRSREGPRQERSDAATASRPKAVALQARGQLLCTSVATSPSGDTYVAGHFSGQLQLGGATLSAGGYSDAFVAKMDGKGRWEWVRQLGSKGDAPGSIEAVRGVSFHPRGGLYITGSFRDTLHVDDNPILGPAGKALAARGSSDIFVARLTAQGRWVWVRQAGSSGSGLETGYGVAAAPDGVYVTGKFSGQAFFGSFLKTAGGSDAFVARLDEKGNWSFVSTLGGAGLDEGKSLTLSAQGQLFGVGYFYEKAQTDPPMNTPLSTSGNRGGFVFQMDGQGRWLWIQALASSRDVLLNDLAALTDPAKPQQVYVVGSYSGTLQGTSHATTGTILNPLVAAYDLKGTRLWATAGRSANDSRSTSVAIDPNSGSAWLTGYFSDQIEFGSHKLQRTAPKAQVYVATVGIRGDWQARSFQAGGAEADSGTGIAWNPLGFFSVVGRFTQLATFSGQRLQSQGRSGLGNGFVWEVP